MKVFVGFGYNDRDKWIEELVFPILEGMGLAVIDGKNMHGSILQPGVEARIDQSDAVIGFFTLRDGQGDADFTSHMWVKDELVYALAKGKPIIPVKEDVAKVPDGLLGNRQYIPLRQSDRLACVTELVRALGSRNLRRVRLEPDTDQLRRDLYRWRTNPQFSIRCRTKDVNEVESEFRPARLEQFDHAFYLNVSNVPKRAWVEIEGVLNGQVTFSSGWVSADAVLVRIA